MKAINIILFTLAASSVWASPDKQALKLAYEMQSAVLVLQDTNQVVALLKQGIDINAPIGCGTFSPIDGAISTKNVEMLEFLLAHGAKPHGPELVQAAFFDNGEMGLKMCQMLLAAGVDHNVRGELGTALVTAAYRGNSRLVTLFLSKPGIKVDEADVDGNTALMWAVKRHDFEIVQMLLKSKASVQPKNRWKEIAISIAEIESAKQRAIVSELQSAPKHDSGDGFK